MLQVLMLLFVLVVLVEIGLVVDGVFAVWLYGLSMLVYCVELVIVDDVEMLRELHCVM